MFIKNLLSGSMHKYNSVIFLLLVAIITDIICFKIYNYIIKKLNPKTILYTFLEDILKKPVIFSIMIIIIWYFKKKLPLDSQTDIFIEKFLILLSLFSVTWIITRIIKALSTYQTISFAKEDKAYLKVLFYSKFLRIFIWTLAFIIALKKVNYDINTIYSGLSIIIGLFIALISIFGISIAMAAKDHVSNYLGGLKIFILQAFQVNDIIEYNGKMVVTKKIKLGYTVFEDFSYNYKIIVPNSHFVGHEIINISSHPGNTILMNIRLSLENDPDKIKLALDIIEKIINNNKRTRLIWLKHDHFDDYSYVLRIHYDIFLFKERIKVKSDINIEIARQFNDNNIKLAQPVWVRIHSESSKDNNDGGP